MALFRSRRRMGGFRARLPREPVMWDRVAPARTIDVTGVYGAVNTLVLWDPTPLVAGVQDLRLTARRVRFAPWAKIVFTAGAAIPQLSAFGVFMGNPGENRSPFFAAAGDQRTDWLWRQVAGFFPAVAAVTVAFSPSSFNTIDGNDLDSVRAMRKLEQDQQLILAFQLTQEDPAADPAPTVSRIVIGVSTSVLYSRTMRTR